MIRPTLNKDTMEQVLIHEICHAVTPGDHSSRFFKRLRKASRDAERIGRLELHKLLEEDLEGNERAVNDYPDARTVAEELYGRIRDVVIIDQPNISYRDLMSAIAEEFGCYPHELKKYRLRRVFDEAKKQAALNKKSTLEGSRI